MKEPRYPDGESTNLHATILRKVAQELTDTALINAVNTAAAEIDRLQAELYRLKGVQTPRQKRAAEV